MPNTKKTFFNLLNRPKRASIIKKYMAGGNLTQKHRLDFIAFLEVGLIMLEKNLIGYFF
jgi:hypothetical protein